MIPRTHIYIKRKCHGDCSFVCCECHDDCSFVRVLFHFPPWKTWKVCTWILRWNAHMRVRMWMLHVFMCVNVARIYVCECYMCFRVWMLHVYTCVSVCAYLRVWMLHVYTCVNVACIYICEYCAPIVLHAYTRKMHPCIPTLMYRHGHTCLVFALSVHRLAVGFSNFSSVLILYAKISTRENKIRILIKTQIHIHIHIQDMQIHIHIHTWRHIHIHIHEEDLAIAGPSRDQAASSLPNILTYTYKDIHMHIHQHGHTHIHACTCKCTNTHAHTHTHTGRGPCDRCRSRDEAAASLPDYDGRVLRSRHHTFRGKSHGAGINNSQPLGINIFELGMNNS